MGGKIMKKSLKIFALIMALCMLAGCGETSVVDSTSDVTEKTVPTYIDESEDQETQVTYPEMEGSLLKFKFYAFPDIADWGDCTYIEFPNGQNMMIDCGMPSAATYIVEDLLDSGIDHLDYVIITHSHADHAKGLSNVLANIKVDKAYTSGYWCTNFEWVERDLGSLGVEIEHICQGSSFDVGEVHFDVLWPTPEYIAEQPGVAAEGTDGPGGTVNINGSSLNLMITYGSKKILMTGDTYKQFQDEIIATYGDELDADFLKIPHHGYDNAANRDFIEIVSPEYAFSMGTHTMTAKLYNWYTATGCTAYLDWMNGNCYMVTNGEEMAVAVDDPTILDYYQSGIIDETESDDPEG